VSKRCPVQEKDKGTGLFRGGPRPKQRSKMLSPSGSCQIWVIITSSVGYIYFVGDCVDEGEHPWRPRLDEVEAKRDEHGSLLSE
jgi:hypothetical protein